MSSPWGRSEARLLALALLVALVAPPLGVLSGRWGFPLLSTLLFYPIFLALVRRGRVAWPMVATLAWVIVHSAVSIAIAHTWGDDYEASVLHGSAYRTEMFHWLETGVGAEGNPREFVPLHLLHLGVFLVFCAVSRSALGLLLGVILLNYMNAYVGALTQHGPPYLMALIGWHPWALLRVTGFLLTAILIARSRIVPPEQRDGMSARAGAVVVAVLIVGDMVLKAALAPWWRELIRSHMMG